MFSKVPSYPILRRDADGDTYTIIGHCFVHGVMFGEVTASNGTFVDDIVVR